MLGKYWHLAHTKILNDKKAETEQEIKNFILKKENN